METPVVNIPENKSSLVKQILAEPGVTIQKQSKPAKSTFKQNLARVSVWTDNDLTVFEESKKAFDSLKPQQW